MNMSAFIGIGLTVGAVVLGIISRSSLMLFIDPTSFLLVALTLPCLMFVSYSFQDMKVYGFGGVWRFLFPSTKAQWSPAESLKAARMANTAGIQAIYLGAVGTLIGTVQMLQAMEDPTKIGPALAVAGLTLLYGFLLNVLICTPTAQHHEQMALKGGASIDALDSTSPVQAGLVVLALIGLAVGVSFLLMLLAMLGWNY